jgi:hypothetical protein
MGDAIVDLCQRRAMRQEIRRVAIRYGEFETAIERGERKFVLAACERLGQVIGLLDAVGSTEQAEAPEVQPVSVGADTVAWAAREALEVTAALGREFEPNDRDLDADAALATNRSPRGSCLPSLIVQVEGVTCAAQCGRIRNSELAPRSTALSTSTG